MTVAAPRVAIRCDALRSLGVGHMIRQFALVEELLQRGWRVTIVGDIEVEWVLGQVQEQVELLPSINTDDFISWSCDTGVDAVMIDGYEFPAKLGEGLRAVGVPVMAMVDGEFGAHQVADVYVDQNLGAIDPGRPGRWLIGPDFVLLRDVVRSRRGQPRPAAEPPRVLVVFGGTDPFAGTPVLADMLLATGAPVEIVAVAANPELTAQMEALPAGDGQSVSVVPPVGDLPGLALTCDAAVSAAGSSVWEFACLGIPTALVCVTDNQRLGYDAASQELCLGVGHLEALRDDPAARAEGVAALRTFVSDGTLRALMGERGASIVDGDGRVRVADALEELARR